MARDQLPAYFREYLDQKFANTDQRSVNIEQKIDGINKVLKGNGQKGLCEEVEDLKLWKTEIMSKATIIIIVLGIVFKFVGEVVANLIK
jgi:hypothetical protein